MGLESSQYIGGLVDTNPVSADPKQEGDDHLRLIKGAVKRTFPNASKEFYFPSSATKTTNYVVLATDQNKILICDSTAGPFNVTLPVLVAGDAGWSVNIVKTTADVNAVTVVATINGVVNYLISTQYVGAHFIWTGGVWLGFAFTSATAPHITTSQIVDDAVTFAKMQNASAASRLLGRGSAAGAGDFEEILLGTGLSMAGTTLNVGATPTYQTFLTGSGNYISSVGVKWIKARVVAAGGGGGGSGGTPTAGGDSSFNGIVANGGAPGGQNSTGGGANGTSGGAGGTAGAGVAPYRVDGQRGGRGQSIEQSVGANVTAAIPGGDGGGTFVGGGGRAGMGTSAGTAGVTNSGGGGGGDGLSMAGSPSGGPTGGGGGGGEYFELILPAGTYPYSVGTGGNAGTGGGAGAAGSIVVEEHYS